PLSFSSTDALALGADRLDAARHRIRLQPRHRDSEHRRGRADRRKQDRQKVRVRKFCDYLVQHRHLLAIKSRTQPSFSSLRLLFPSSKAQLQKSFARDWWSTMVRCNAETKRRAPRRRETAPRR